MAAGVRFPWFSVALGALLIGGGIALMSVSNSVPETTAQAAEESDRFAIDGDRAFDYLVKICEIGPRPSGSDGMEQQQQLLSTHFTKLGAKVGYQTFDARHPVTGNPVRMSNLIVSWQPAATERILLCCHYDTRPFPDRDSNPNLARSGKFLGANDGASGVALFMELANHMAKAKPTYGVDFVFFDGEELVYGEGDPYFLGSEHFARSYKNDPPKHRYLYGVLVDMVADKNLELFEEANSLKFAPQLTRSIWNKAKELGIKEFVARQKHEVLDDHLALNRTAKIPTCDLIDFDYPHWHTTRDVPASCSGASLAKVGKVLLAWLHDVPPPTSAKKK